MSLTSVQLRQSTAAEALDCSSLDKQLASVPEQQQRDIKKVINLREWWWGCAAGPKYNQLLWRAFHRLLLRPNCKTLSGQTEYEVAGNNDCLQEPQVVQHTR